jgi:nucleotide-binding universal stress UspA family protein
VTYLVAFDGRPRSTAALRRAAALAEDTDARLVVGSVLPTDEAFAEAYDLLEDGEYDLSGAADRLRRRAREVAPDAAFRAERVDTYAGKGRIADRLRRMALDESADLVFLGTDGAGRVVRRLSRVEDDAAYDLFVVRVA